ncbi:bifunctional ADP-dependent NAD(P)H-hydrate dehydratase/NAD(P)H-hydrate epimerase [Longispora albida]|uniref:bifunctional ADP-dependent NAD(P)H-hydrate dehydratase/NAD(P)H-hydrate epimerase n=1 Tax=Longispora albida TaxID=203523 RepID=UPI000476F06A|nr:bifunctional ADP-dependent NAD(P)H-hydrate dehydratase/NAD(P)H-hydrate epimerase [Longispora albida]
MRGVWTVADIRQAERKQAHEPLMARAATGLARRCTTMLSSVYGARVLLLIGSGANGGDALLAGAQLARRGAQCSALLLSERYHAEGMAAFRAAGGRIVSTVVPADLVIDGIVGIGGTGGLRSPLPELPEAPVIAVDLPSGVDADTGAVPGLALKADVTVTFGCLKPGLVAGEGAQYAGQVDVVDIGFELPEPRLWVADIGDVAARWPWPRTGDDKYSRGVVGIAAGSRRYPGAGVLAVGGASAGPAGYIRYAGAGASAVRDHHPHVVTTDRLADAGRVQAWVVGPGLSLDSPGQADLRTAILEQVPLCLDADALTLIAAHPGWLEGREKPLVLTPHDGEYERLAGHPPGPDRVAAARDLAARMNATVLLKGPRTVIADPDGTAFVNPTGTPALATAGTGDVLAGLLGSLLAGGVEPIWAAVCAAYVHGLAGQHAARSGPVTASDVAAALRPVVSSLLS